MKITSEQIMNILDINVGDYIIRNGIEYTVKRTKDEEGYILVDPDGYTLTFGDLVDNEFILHKPKKKVGETCCCDYDECTDCPLYYLYGCKDRSISKNETLYDLISTVFYMKCGDKAYADHPIYLAFRAELDKEVE